MIIFKEGEKSNCGYYRKVSLLPWSTTNVTSQWLQSCTMRTSHTLKPNGHNLHHKANAEIISITNHDLLDITLSNEKKCEAADKCLTSAESHFRLVSATWRHTGCDLNQRIHNWLGDTNWCYRCVGSATHYSYRFIQHTNGLSTTFLAAILCFTSNKLSWANRNDNGKLFKLCNLLFRSKVTLTSGTVLQYKYSTCICTCSEAEL